MFADRPQPVGTAVLPADGRTPFPRKQTPMITVPVLAVVRVAAAGTNFSPQRTLIVAHHVGPQWFMERLDAAVKSARFFEGVLPCGHPLFEPPLPVGISAAFIP